MEMEMGNWRRLFHLLVTVFLSNFAGYVILSAMTDVTVEAVCGGRDQCSLSIYLTGIQQAITGLGAVLMMPLIGKLSDVYGRKAILQIPLILAIIPFAILAWNRTTTFFYVHYVFKTITGMITAGGVICLSLAYLADNVSERNRVAAFGILSGVFSAANLASTLAARFLSIAQIFQVATIVSILAVVYVRVFLEESRQDGPNSQEEPILSPDTEKNILSSSKINIIDDIPSPKEVIRLLKSSAIFSLAAGVTLSDSLAEAGVQACLLYFLKARFQFKKDQIAEILLITFGGSTISTLFFLPAFGPFIGEETLLLLAMLAGSINMFFDSIAWSPSVIYASSSLSFFFALATPVLKSLVSKHSGPNEQGIAQGSVMAITSFANVISPLLYSPISALFLSEDAPFHFPGFGVACIGLAYLIGLFMSIWIKILSYSSRSKVISNARRE